MTWNKLRKNHWAVIVLKLAIIVLVWVNGINVFIPIISECSQKSSVENVSIYSDNVSLSVEKVYTNVFTAKGSSLMNVKIFILQGCQAGGAISFEIFDGAKCIASTAVSVCDLSENTYTPIDIHTESLISGKSYSFKISTSGDRFGKIVIGNAAEQPMIILSFSEGFLSGRKIIQGIFIGVALILACIGLTFLVRNYNEIKKIFWEGHSRTTYLYGIVIGLSFSLLYNPICTENTRVISFSRQIGYGIIRDYDVSRVVLNFVAWGFSALFLSVCFILLINYMKRKLSGREVVLAWHFLDMFMVLAGVNLILKFVTFFSSHDFQILVFCYSHWVINLIIAITLTYILLMSKKVAFKIYFSLFIGAFSLAFPIVALSGIEWGLGELLFTVQVMLILLITVFLYVSDIQMKSTKCLNWFLLFAACCPLFLSVYIEGVNILNQYSVFVVNMRYWFVLMLTLCVIAFGGLYFIFRKSEKAAQMCGNLIYPVLIGGISALSVQIPLTGVYSAHIFESANSSVLISDFLNFGKIPIVEHFGAHMLYGVGGGIVYGLLNSDYEGAIMSPYAVYSGVLVAIAMFLFLKEFIGKKMAFLTVLCTPLVSFYGVTGMGLFIIVAICGYVRNNTWIHALWIWLSFIWCLLFRLDLGVAFVISGLIALVIYIISERNKKILKQLGLSLAGLIFFLGVLWFIICIMKNVDPVKRIIEFLMLCISDKNWAYNSLGDSSYFVFSFCYIFMPITVIALLTYVIISKKCQQQMGKASWMSLIMIGLSFFSWFSRVLARHSLFEGAANIAVIATGYLFVAAAISCMFNKKLFLPSIFTMIIFNNLLISGISYNAFSPIDIAMEKANIVDTWVEAYKDEKTCWEKYKEIGTPTKRVLLDNSIENLLDPMKTLVNFLLTSNETYIDFMNYSFSYSVLQKECPVYIVQSPMLLSGEITQDFFVDEISKNIDANPIVFFPLKEENAIHMDGIVNSYRYYKLSEYIYSNYVPLCSFGDYAVWCDKNKYKKYYNLILENYENSIILEHKSTEYVTNNLMVMKKNNSFFLTPAGADPYWQNFGEYLNLESLDSENPCISIDVNVTLDAFVQLYYTNREGELFSEEKSIIKAVLPGSNSLAFELPSSEIVNLRLDISESGTVVIESVSSTQNMPNMISYDYDGGQHNYILYELPRIWAEAEKRAASNPVLIKAEKKKEIYSFEGLSQIDKLGGNYIKLTTCFAGDDVAGFVENDDEITAAVLHIGTLGNDGFENQASFSFNIAEGTHEYIFRVSADYNWYSENIDALVLECNEPLTNVQIEILQGD